MTILAIAGPSGSGKSALALDLARSWVATRRPIAILCADSITVYRGCNIGSAKPAKEEQTEFPHHLLDLKDPDEDFTAADFVRAADPVIERMQKEHGLALLVGGTGFYLRALFQGMTEEDDLANAASESYKELLQERLNREGSEALYQEMLALDPELREKIHPNDHYRVIRALQAMEATGKRWSVLNQEARARPPRYPDINFFCLELPREILAKRLRKRSQTMLELGLLAEVKDLASRFSPECKALQSVGYRECLEYLGLTEVIGERPKTTSELADKITQSTLRLAKRQMTWFRGEKRVEWLRGSDPAAFLPKLKERLSLS